MPRSSRRTPRPRRAFRPSVQELEDRRLLAAPAIDPLQIPLNVPAGKTLIVPISAADPAGGSVSYSVTSDNPQVQVIAHQDNTFLDLSVAGFGDLEFELFKDLTPQTVGLISGMVQSDFYNGLTFHRVVKGFAVQGGDPAGNGTGGPGFQFDDEFNPQAIFSGSGQLAMANSGKDTNGSQFFITDGPQRFLDFNHTIFGQLVRGFDVLHAIENVPVTLQDPTNPNSEDSRPVTPVVITSARIVPDATAAVFTLRSTGTGPATAHLTITATASTGGSTTETVAAQVFADSTNDPPILGPVSDQVSPGGGPVTIHLTRTDLENDASTFGAAVLPADANNATVSTVNNADGTADVTVTPTTGFTGAVRVLVGVKEQGASSRGSDTYPWDTQQITVAFGDQPLTALPGGTVTVTEGVPASGVTVGGFTDPDLTAGAGDFRVSINWGDGTPPDTATGQVTGSNGYFSVAGTHTYKEAGTYPVRVAVTDAHQAGTSGGDNGGATATLTATAVVADVPLTAGQPVTVTGTAGSALGGVVATFTDANAGAPASDFTARIDWGDGTTSAGSVVASGGGFQVVGGHVYASPSQYPVRVSVTDGSPVGVVAATTSATATAVVAPAPPAPTPVPQPAPVAPPPPSGGGHHRHLKAHNRRKVRRRPPKKRLK